VENVPLKRLIACETEGRRRTGLMFTDVRVWMRIFIEKLKFLPGHFTGCLMEEKMEFRYRGMIQLG
jgi:hypothetical protein